MADFEELKLTVTLVDDASAGLANIRTQLTQLTQTAGQVSTALSGVAASTQQVGQAHQQATPHVSSQEKALKELARSAEDTTRNLVQMGLASRQGVAGFTELALATRGAFSGLQGVNAGMTELGAASRLMVVGLGGVALGVAAVGAAVAAYGISVFKFSQEMFTLSQTAKSLGVTFGQMKSLTDQNKAFGISVDQTVGQVTRLQEAMTDLSESGSKLRQELIGHGMDPNTVDRISRETDLIRQQNMARQLGLDIERARLAEGRTPTAARGEANKALSSMGFDPSIMDRKAAREPTAAELAQSKSIEETSRKIAEQWADIYEKIASIKDAFLAWGLPSVLTAVSLINENFGGILTTIKSIASFGARQLPILGQLLQLYDVYKSLRGQEGTASPGPGGAAAGPRGAAPAAGPSDSFSDRWSALKSPGSFRFSGGANDNVNPLLHKASFGGDTGGSSGEGRAQAIIKGGVYEALVDFATYMRTGGTGTGGGAGGIVNASFGGAGKATAGGGDGTPVGNAFAAAKAGIPSSGPNAAGNAGIPNGYRGSTASTRDGSPAGTSADTINRATGAPADAGRPASGKRGERIAAAKTAMKDQLIKDGVPEANAEEASNQLAGQALAESDLNPGLSHDQGTGHGIYGARNERRAGMDKWLSDKGYDKNSLEGQSRYMAHEAMTGKDYGQTRAALMGATPGNRAATTDTVTRNFERPARVNNRTGQVSEAAGVRAAAPPTAGAPGTKVASLDPNQVLGNAKGTTPTGGVPSRFSADVAAMTAAGAKPKNIQDYLASHGVNMSEADCGHFMAQQVREHGGTPPQNAAVASSWNSFGGKGGGGYSDDPNAINVAVKQGVSSGIGSHVTAAIPIRDEKGNITGFRGVGVNQGRKGVPGATGDYGRNIISSNPISIGDAPGQYHIRHQIPEAPDRAALNQPLDRSALNDNNKIHSTGKLDVNVNAPPGTKVNYHGQNLLKNTSMQRQTQMMPTSTGPSVGDSAQSYMRGGT